ncbi:MAG: HD domain-containing protein [Deltaproteobacteria bacterium]|nr:MAG: HD domain-containing protein [Deltaproteobacteria bacterium]
MKDKKYTLIISDQRMPDMEGTVFLEKARQIAPDTVRILLTGYADMQAAIDAINRCGVYRFLTKPWNDEEIKVTLKRAIEFSELEKGFVSTVRLLSQMGEMHSAHIGNHSKRVADLSRKIAQELKLSEDMCFQIEMAAMLHDIGKIAVPSSILEKEESKLNDVELSQLKKHVLQGELIALMIPNLSEAAHMIRHHHEKFDGTGYPDKLRTDAIPLGSRIITIADSFDKLVNHKNHHEALSPAKAVDFLMGSRKEYFDPEILKVLKGYLSTKTSEIPQTHEVTLAFDKLELGMVLSKDIKTINDLLILPQGTLLNEKTILLLKKYIESAPVVKEVSVFRSVI